MISWNFLIGYFEADAFNDQLRSIGTMKGKNKNINNGENHYEHYPLQSCGDIIVDPPYKMPHKSHINQQLKAETEREKI